MSVIFGREQDIQEVRALFESGERFVTLLGPPGIGKTRVAEEIARVEGTSVWIDLAEAHSLDDVLALASAALGVVAGGDRATTTARVARALSAREDDLIVFDTFEHVVEHAAETVGRWVATTTTTRFLVTSREVLRVADEWTHELEPLALPRAGEPPEACASLRLLMDRARRAGRRGTFEGPAIAALSEIARQLDGIPLALELAAYRVAVLGETTVLSRLAERLDLLSGSARSTTSRQRTLRDAIAWSYRMLDAVEQRALAECAVFQGTFTVEAAEAVVRVGTGATLDVLQALREKSLLQGVHETEPDSTGASSRFRLLLSIRDFAREQLDASETAAAVERHREYYVAFAERIGIELRAKQDRALIARLEADQENLSAVLERVRAIRPASETSRKAQRRTVFAIAPLVLARGPFAPLLDALDETLAEPSEVEGRELATTLVLRARLLRRLGRLDESMAILEAILAKLPAGIPEVPRVLGELAWTAYSRGRQRDAVALWTRARDARRTCEPFDVFAEGADLVRTSMALRELGDRADAEVLATEALTLSRHAGNAIEEAMALGMLGILASDRGDVDQAVELATRGVDRCRAATGSKVFEGYAMSSLSIASHLRGDLEATKTFLLGVHEGLAALGHARQDAMAVLHLGLVAWERGQLREAWANVDDARASFEGLNDVGHVELASACLAGLEAEAGTVLQARKRLEAIQHRDPTPLARASALHAMHVDLAEAHALARAGDVSRATAAMNAIASAREAMGPPVSYPERIALRVLDAKARAPRATIPLQARIDLGAGDDITCTVAGADVDLRRRGPARAMLRALARNRVQNGFAPMSWTELADAAWPGEKILQSAARNRVKVTIAWLRKAGLREVIVSDDRGYWLAEDCELGGAAPPAVA